MKLNETNLYKLLEEKQDTKSIDELEKAHWYLMSIHGTKMRETPTTIEYMNEVTNDYYTIYTVTDITITSLYINFEENKIHTECTLYYFLGQVIIEFATIDRVEEYIKTYYNDQAFLDAYGIRFYHGLITNEYMINFELIQNRNNINLILKHVSDSKVIDDLIKQDYAIVRNKLPLGSRGATIDKYKISNQFLDEPFTYITIDGNKKAFVIAYNEVLKKFITKPVIYNSINDVNINSSVIINNVLNANIDSQYISDNIITFDKEFVGFKVIQNMIIPNSLLTKGTIALTHLLLNEYRYNLLDQLIRAHVKLMSNPYVKIESNNNRVHRIKYHNSLTNVYYEIELKTTHCYPANAAYELQITYTDPETAEVIAGNNFGSKYFTVNKAIEYIFKYYGQEVLDKLEFFESYFIFTDVDHSSFNNSLSNTVLRSENMINEICRLVMCDNPELISNICAKHDELQDQGIIFNHERVPSVIPFTYIKDESIYVLQYEYEDDNTNEVNVVCVTDNDDFMDDDNFVDEIITYNNVVNNSEPIDNIHEVDYSDDYINYQGETYPITEATLKLLLKLISK